MKNVFFILAFMLVGTFTFANNAEVGTIEKNIVVEDVFVINEEHLEGKMVCGFPVYYDDGGAGDWGGSGEFWMECDDDTTMRDILDTLLALFF